MPENKSSIILIILILFKSYTVLLSRTDRYPWRVEEKCQYKVNMITAPAGFERIEYGPGSFQNWLQNLPVKSSGEKVKLHDGRDKSNQNAHFRVIDIDIGTKNLQQCADAVIRLYAEYLYSQNEYRSIAFHFTSGDLCQYESWIDGYRSMIKNNRVRWRKTARYDHSYKNFRNYLDVIFAYAGSYSLSRELLCVDDLSDIDVGDVFIQGGFPGHAVIVVDMAGNQNTHKKIFMIAQSFMPAQDVHILKNPENETISPWYELKATDELFTPEWTFHWTDLKRFP